MVRIWRRSTRDHELAGRGGYTQLASARLLSGSTMSVMGRLLAGKRAAARAGQRELIIRPFGYRDAAKLWDIGDPHLAVLVHSIVGGTPAYRREFVGGDSPTSLADFDAGVLRTVLNSQLPLFREGRYLLAEEAEIRDTAVLGAMTMKPGGTRSWVPATSSGCVGPVTCAP